MDFLFLIFILLKEIFGLIILINIISLKHLWIIKVCNFNLYLILKYSPNKALHCYSLSSVDNAITHWYYFNCFKGERNSALHTCERKKIGRVCGNCLLKKIIIAFILSLEGFPILSLLLKQQHFIVKRVFILKLHAFTLLNCLVLHVESIRIFCQTTKKSRLLNCFN